MVVKGEHRILGARAFCTATCECRLRDADCDLVRGRLARAGPRGALRGRLSPATSIRRRTGGFAVKVRASLRRRWPRSTVWSRSIWPAANWMEREVFDLYGIRFRNGHPDLRQHLAARKISRGTRFAKTYPKRAASASGPARGTARMSERARRISPKRWPLSTTISSGDLHTAATRCINMGPSHPSTHGTVKFLDRARGREHHQIVDSAGRLSAPGLREGVRERGLVSSDPVYRSVELQLGHSSPTSGYLHGGREATRRSTRPNVVSGCACCRLRALAHRRSPDSRCGGHVPRAGRR